MKGRVVLIVVPLFGLLVRIFIWPLCALIISLVRVRPVPMPHSFGFLLCESTCSSLKMSCQCVFSIPIPLSVMSIVMLFFSFFMSIVICLFSLLLKNRAFFMISFSAVAK